MKVTSLSSTAGRIGGTAAQAANAAEQDQPVEMSAEEIPADALETADADAFTWQVPGLREELYVLRTLLAQHAPRATAALEAFGTVTVHGPVTDRQAENVIAISDLEAAEAQVHALRDQLKAILTEALAR